MTAREQALPVDGYETNAAFLKAKYDEVALQLECAGLRRQLRQWDRPWSTGSCATSQETMRVPADHLRQRLETSELALRRHQAVVEERLTASDGSEVPFLDLLERCGLPVFDGQVLWLLFFMAVSPELRDQYEQLELGEWDGHDGHGMCIGDLLRVLCSKGIGDSMEARSRFGVDAPLMAHHLVRMDRSGGKPSILDVELELPQRVVSWMSGDTHRYTDDSSCRVEWPTEEVDQVVLEDGVVGRLLRMVDHYEEFRARRLDLGLADAASYGSGLVILEHGPPGTGKTLLARALARRTGKPLVSLMDLSRRYFEAEDLECLFREARLQDGILPSETARLRIWQLHLGKAPLAADVDLARLAREYPMAGGYIKNAAQTAVTEALACEGELVLRQGDLEAACRLQEDRVCEEPRVGRRYRPQQPVEDLLAGEKLRERLLSLALALARKSDILRSWLGAEGSETGGVRVLFHGGDFEAAMEAADALAAEMDRAVLRVRMRELCRGPDVSERRSKWVQDWPFGLIEAAAQAGQVVAIADPLGQLGDDQESEGKTARGVLSECARSPADLFVVSGRRFRTMKGWGDLFHESVDVTPAEVEVRADQWRRLLGSRAGAIDLDRLAEAFPATGAQMRMALERAALRAGAAGEEDLAEEELWEAVRGVMGRRWEEGLFG